MYECKYRPAGKTICPLGKRFERRSPGTLGPRRLDRLFGRTAFHANFICRGGMFECAIFNVTLSADNLKFRDSGAATRVGTRAMQASHPSNGLI